MSRRSTWVQNLVLRIVLSAITEAGGCWFVPSDATPTARAGSITSSRVDRLCHPRTNLTQTKSQPYKKITTALSILWSNIPKSTACLDRYKSTVETVKIFNWHYSTVTRLLGKELLGLPLFIQQKKNNVWVGQSAFIGEMQSVPECIVLVSSGILNTQMLASAFNLHAECSFHFSTVFKILTFKV